MTTHPSDMCGQLYLQVLGGTLGGFINLINMLPSLIIFGTVVGIATASDIAAIGGIDAKVLFPAAIVSTLALLMGLAGAVVVSFWRAPAPLGAGAGMQTRETMCLHRGSLLPGDPDEAPEDDHLANATR